MQYGVWQVYERPDVSEQVVHRGSFETLKGAKQFAEEHAVRTVTRKDPTVFDLWVDWRALGSGDDIPSTDWVGVLNKYATSRFHVVFAPVQ